MKSPKTSAEKHDEATDEALSKFDRLAGIEDRAAEIDSDTHHLADVLDDIITPITAEEYEAARHPHPHVFGDGISGLFPVGEVTVIGAPPRSGKTTLIVRIAADIVLAMPVCDLQCQRPGSVLVYSREDDREQYARKIEGVCDGLSKQDAELVKRSIIPPNLRAPGIREASHIIDICEKRHRPIETETVDAFIDAVRRKNDKGANITVIMFETASTLSRADEDNKGLGELASSLKKIAQDLGVAVVLTHHLSQDGNTRALPALELSTALIRGATSLVADTRQVLLMVDLGSQDKPLPDSDRRSWLYRYLQGPDGYSPHAGARLTMMIPLDTSKAMDPRPLFMRWVRTPYDPTMEPIELPESIADAAWLRIRQVVLSWATAQSSKAAGEKRTQKSDAEVDAVVNVVRLLESEGEQPTARKVADKMGRSPGWPASRLARGKDLGILRVSRESVPRAGMCDVFRSVSTVDLEPDEGNDG